MTPKMIAESMRADPQQEARSDTVKKAVRATGVKAVKRGDEIFISMDRCSPEDLRKLADALEQLGVTKVTAQAEYNRKR